MKTALIRLLTVATLASSMSAFAATDDSKPNDAANAATTKQQDCAAADKGKKHKKAKPSQSQSQSDDQKDKDYDRALLGIYG
jgi:hypothetical protein